MRMLQFLLKLCKSRKELEKKAEVLNIIIMFFALLYLCYGICIIWNSVSNTLIPTNFDAGVKTLICSVLIMFVSFGRFLFSKPENVRCLNLHCIMAGVVIIALMVLVAKNQQREQDFQMRVYKECNFGLSKTHPLTEDEECKTKLKFLLGAENVMNFALWMFIILFIVIEVLTIKRCRLWRLLRRNTIRRGVIRRERGRKVLRQELPDYHFYV